LLGKNVWVIVHGGSSEERSECMVGRICKTGELAVGSERVRELWMRVVSQQRKK